MKKYDNYAAQLAVLERAKDEDLSNEFVMSGVTNKFALQFGLAWKLLKETLAYEGVAAAASGSPREILKAVSTMGTPPAPWSTASSRRIFRSSGL